LAVHVELVLEAVTAVQPTSVDVQSWHELICVIAACATTVGDDPVYVWLVPQGGELDSPVPGLLTIVQGEGLPFAGTACPTEHSAAMNTTTSQRIRP
jgi:hypothetical protein